MRVQQSDVLYVFRLDCDGNDGRLMSFNQLVLLTCSLLLNTGMETAVAREAFGQQASLWSLLEEDF